LVDLPSDVADGLASGTLSPPSGPPPARAPSPAELARAVRVLLGSQRPLVYAGGGARWGGAVDDLRAFVEVAQVPVVPTLMGLGSVPVDHPLFLGMVGPHGSAAASLAVQHCDVLLCVGARFDDRTTGRLAELAPHATVIHLDADTVDGGKLRS